MIPILDQPHHQLRALLATGAPVFLSVNPVEYHGPHLSLHNDALISAGLTRALHARLAVAHPDWPLLVGQDIQAGVDPAPGPGTRVTSFRALRRMLFEAVDALAAVGAQKVVLMTFHGSPMHSSALQAAAERLIDRGIPCFCPMNTMLHVQLSFDPDDLAPMVTHIADPATRAAVLAGTRTDFHAGFLETSLTLHYAPESVSPRLSEVPPCPPFSPDPILLRLSRLIRRLGAEKLAEELAFAAQGTGWYSLDPFPGYTATPHHATAEAGAFLAGQLLDRMVEDCVAAFAGKPVPGPVLSWMTWLTLQGRLPGPHAETTPISL